MLAVYRKVHSIDYYSWFVTKNVGILAIILCVEEYTKKREILRKLGVFYSYITINVDL